MIARKTILDIPDARPRRPLIIFFDEAEMSDPVTDPSPFAHIEALFAARGRVSCAGARRAAVSALEHALQCAQFAEWAHARDSLVAAAFLHDIGHLLIADSPAHADGLHDRHEDLAADLLAADFGPAVSEPIRLHVQAKRFLVRADDGYAGTLSPASRRSLELQGGPMSSDEMVRFKRLPHADDAVLLRCWDDLAKQPGRSTPPLAYYLPLLQEVRDRYRAGAGAVAKTLYSS